MVHGRLPVRPPLFDVSGTLWHDGHPMPEALFALCEGRQRVEPCLRMGFMSSTLGVPFLDYSRPVRNQIVKALWRKNSRCRPFRLSTTNQDFSALSAQVRPIVLIVISSLPRCGAMWTQLRRALVAIGAFRFFHRDMPN